MRRVIPVIAVSILVLASSLPTAALPRHYTYTDLGILTPASTQRSLSINDAGWVVGSYRTPTDHAFLWKRSDDVTDLGAFAGGWSNAYAVDSAGVVVGQSTCSDGNNHPFIWRQGIGLSDLGTLGGTHGAARGINAAGQVVGASMDTSGANRAFIWQQGLGMKAIGTLGGIVNEAWAISDSGTVVGIEQPGTGDDKGWHTRAFVWDSSAGIRELPGIGGRRNGAYDINGAGQVAGFVENSSRARHAALWPDLLHALDLGALAGSQSTSIARGINDLTQVVGSSVNASGGTSAFVWDQTAGMVDLNTMIANKPANVWLTDASAINNQGCIVGMASIGSYQFRAYLLTPSSPEPGSLLVLGTGLISLAASARRRRPATAPAEDPAGQAA